MFSPKTYIQQLLTKKFENLLENFNESYFNLSLWEGNVDLSNLKLKSNVFDLTDELQATLEYGHIGSLSINAPWSKIRQGDVRASADNICLVLRIHQTINTLGSQYSQTLNKGSKPKSSENNFLVNWASQAANKLAFKWLISLIGGFSMELSNVQISILVPTTTESSMHLHVMTCFKSFHIYKNENSDFLDDFILDVDKSTLLEGFTVGITEMPCPKYPEEYAALHSTSIIDIIVNPIHVSVECQIPSVEEFLNTDPGTLTVDSRPKISLNISVDNVEFSILVAHLEIACDVFQAIGQIVKNAIDIRSRYLEALVHHPDDKSISTAAKLSLKHSNDDDKINSSIQIEPIAKASKQSSISISLNIIVNRLAFSLTDLHDDFDDSQVHSPRSKSANLQHSRLSTLILTLAVYGTKLSYINTLQTEGKVLVGAVKVYGIDGVDIISCGGNPDEWLEYFYTLNFSNITDTKNLSLQPALNLSCVIVNSVPDKTVVEGKSNELNLEDLHNNVEFSEYENIETRSDISDSSSVISLASAQGDTCQASSSLTCVIDTILVQLHVETFAFVKHLALKMISQNSQPVAASRSYDSFSNLQDNSQISDDGNTRDNELNTIKSPLKLLFSNVDFKLVGIVVWLSFPSEKIFPENTSRHNSDPNVFKSPFSSQNGKVDWIALSIGEICLLEGQYLRDLSVFHHKKSSKNNNELHETLIDDDDDNANVNELSASDTFCLWQKKLLSWPQYIPDHSESQLASDRSILSRTKCLISTLNSSNCSQTILFQIKGIDLVILKSQAKNVTLAELNAHLVNFRKKNYSECMNDGNISKITQRPWFLSLVLSRNLQDKQFKNRELSPRIENDCSIRVDMYASSLDIITTSEDLVSLTDLIHKISLKFEDNKTSYNIRDANGRNENRGSPQSKAPLVNSTRLMNKAGSCLLSFHSHFDMMSLSLVNRADHNENSAETLLTSSLLRWTTTLISRGIESPSTLRCKRLCIQELMQFGFPVDEIISTLEEIVEMVENDTDEFTITSDVIILAGNMLSSQKNKTSSCFSTQNGPLLRIIVNTLSLHYVQLAYDSSVNVQVRDIYLADHNYQPIVHIGCKKLYRRKISNKKESSFSSKNDLTTPRRRGFTVVTENEAKVNTNSDARNGNAIHSNSSAPPINKHKIPKSPSSKRSSRSKHSRSRATSFDDDDDDASISSRIRNIPHRPTKRQSKKKFSYWPWFLHDNLDGRSDISYGLTFSYDEKDSGWDWGSGGYISETLNKESLKESVRDGNLSVSLKYFEINVNAKSLLQVLNTSMEEYVIIRTHWEILSAFHRNQHNHHSSVNLFVSPIKERPNIERETPFDKSGKPHINMNYNHLNEQQIIKHASITDLTVEVQIHSADVALSINEDTHMCALNFSKLKYEADMTLQSTKYYNHNNELIKHVDSENTFKYMKLVVSSASISDLTDLGALHHQILWRKRESSTEPNTMPPMIIVEINFTNDRVLMIQAILEHVRFCLLFRFITELIAFFQENLTVPIKEVFTNSFEELDQKLKEADTLANHVASTVTFNEQLNFPYRMDKLPFNSENEGLLDHLSDASFEGMDDASSTISEKSETDSYASSSSGSTVYSVRLRSNSRMNLNGQLKSVSDPKVKVFLTPQTTNYPLKPPKKSQIPTVNEVEDPSPTKPQEKDWEVQWCLGLVDLIIFDPRHSSSHDMLGLRIGYGSVCNMQPSESWSLPEAPVNVSENQPPLYFDLNKNSWNLPKSDFGHLYRRTDSWISTRSSVHSLNSPTIYSPVKHWRSFRSSFGQSFRSMNDVTDGFEDENVFYDCGSTIEQKQGPRKLNRSFQFNVQPNPSDNWTFRSNAQSKASNLLLSRLVVSISDVNAFITLARIFSDSQESEPTRLIIPECLIFEDIDDNCLVYKPSKRSKGPLRSQLNRSNNKAPYRSQTWQKVSLIPFSLLLVLDQTTTQTRLLITDTYSSRPDDASLRFKMSMAEFYALLSAVWFDNFFETPQRFDPMKEIDEPSNNSPLSENPVFSMPWPRYGSKEYWEYARNNRSNYFFMGIVRADVSFECSMDTRYFSKSPNSLQYLIQSTKGTNSPYPSRNPSNAHQHLNISIDDIFDGLSEVLPFAIIHVTGLALQLQFDADVLQLTIGAGSVDVFDIRDPYVSVLPIVLQVPSRPSPLPRSYRQDSQSGTFNGNYSGTFYDLYQNDRRSILYGFTSFDYGINQNPSFLINGVNDSILPVQYSFFSSLAAYWKTNNIGIDSANLTISNVDFFLLVADFFSNYFRFPEYGHPGVEAYSRLNKDTLPYGGIDTRLFLSRPFITVMEDPKNLSSQMICLDVPQGLFYRYTLDSNSSVKSELRLYNVAVVLFKSYETSDKARGCRGSAGSGRGVRTVVEYLSCGISYHFDSLRDHVDIAVDMANVSTLDDDPDIQSSPVTGSPTAARRKSLYPVSASNVRKPYVDFEEENIKLSPINIGHPRTIITLEEPSASFTADSCDIVTSYEDIVTILSAFKNVITLKSMIPPNSPQSVGSANSHPTSIRTDSPSPSRQGSNKGRNRMSTDILEATSSPSVSNPDLPYDIFALISIEGVKVLLVDNVLGLHLPLFQIFLEKYQLNIDYSLSATKSNNQQAVNLALGSHRNKNRLTSSNNKHFRPVGHLDEKKTTLAYSVLLFWGDYFNNNKKCWEPLLERLNVSVLYERGPLRGQGVTVRTYSTVHLNISGALIRTIGDTIKMIHNTISYHASREKESEIININNNDNTRTDAIRAFGSQTNLFDDHITVDSPNAASILEYSTQDISKTFYNKMPDVNLRKNSITKKGRRSNNFSATGTPVPFLGLRNTRPTIDSILHCRSNDLANSVRVGFSIQNMTGQPIRYLQQWADGRWRVQYVNHSERGLLNFIASTTLIRNNQLVEEAFNVQTESGFNRDRNRNKQKCVGHEVPLQISGYRWLRAVQADVLSVKYHDLFTVIGRRNPLSGSTDWKMKNALKLVTQVVPHNGGRMLRLRSVFSFKNNTSHVIELLAQEATNSDKNGINLDNSETSGPSGGVREVPFKLDAGETFYVPLALLHRSALVSNMKSLGRVYMRPGDLKPVEDELGPRSQTHLANIDYSNQCVNLFSIATRTATLLTEMGLEDKKGSTVSGRDLIDTARTEICCYMHAKSKRWQGYQRRSSTADSTQDKDIGSSTITTSKLPPFCYTIEIQRVGTLLEGKKDINRVRQIQEALAGRFFHSKEHQERTHSPIHYNIVIHPPLILENLLPLGGVFEIVHATQQKRVLWSSWIDPGKAVPIHTVTLEEPLVLLINLKYCRTPDGVIIHQPLKNSEGTIAGKIQRTLEGFLDEGNDEDISSVLLTDTVGQRLMLSIDNVQGRGGQRHVTIYCPYWIVNTSQYTIRIREEGNPNLPAGSVTPQLDGSKPVAMVSNFSVRERMRQEELHRNMPSTDADIGNRGTSAKENLRSQFFGHGTIFPGTRGIAHSGFAKEFAYDSNLHNLLANMSFEDIVKVAYMFNFSDRSSLGLGRVSVQLDETDWSRPFSLDTVGVNQMVSVDNSEYGVFEVAFKIKAAQGRLGKYTKIVRFLPKFIVVNRLEHNVRFLQPVGFATSKREIEVSSGHIRPFHLPELYGERKLTLQVDGLWTKTVPFEVDQVGSNTLMVKQSFNLATLRHVNTRGAPEYTVHFPNKEIGLWFETDWGEQNTVVKSITPGKYAATETDIQVGDVLLSIDGEKVNKKPFELVLLTLKSRLREPGGCHVTFRTVEEKIRLIRNIALKGKGSKRRRNSFSLGSPSPTHGQSFHSVDEEFGPPGSPGGRSINRYHSIRSPSPHSREKHRAFDDAYVSTPSSHSENNVVFRSFSSKAIIAPSREDSNPDKIARNSSMEQLFGAASDPPNVSDESHRDSYMPVRVDIRTTEACTVIIVRPVNSANESEYRIDNLSVSHIIYYKQKGVNGPWGHLCPGHSSTFIWDDPFKPHKLLLLASRNILCPEEERDLEVLRLLGTDGVATSTLGFLSGVAVDQSIVEIQFDEIGRSKHLPLPHSDAKLHVEVKSQGPAKTLVISPERSLIKTELKFSTQLINEQIILLNEVCSRFNALVNRVDEHLTYGSVETLFNMNSNAMLQKLQEFQKNLLESAISSSNANFKYDYESNTPPTPLDNPINNQAQHSSANYNLPKLTAYSPLQSVLGLNITKQHQLAVDILEAKDLTPFVAGKLEDVYCKVYLKSPAKYEKGSSLSQPKYTYVCSQTLDPVWIGQRFLFDIPADAANDLRGFSLRVSVKSKTIIQLNRFLGQTDIHFSGLKAEEEVQGWFPLQPETSSFTTTVTTGIITGSIKLRLQYIHSNTGLAKYILKAHEKRIEELKSYYEIQFNMLLSLRKIKFSTSPKSANLDPVTNILSNSLALTTDGLIAVSSNAGAVISKTTDIVMRSLEYAGTSAVDFVLGKDVLSKPELEKKPDDETRVISNPTISIPKRRSGPSGPVDSRGRLAPVQFSLKTPEDCERQKLSNEISDKVHRASVAGESFAAISSKEREGSRKRRYSLHSPNLMKWANNILNYQEVIFSKHSGEEAIPMHMNQKTTQSTMNAQKILNQRAAILACDTMKRSPRLLKDNLSFTARCLEEAKRSFAHVHLTTGTLTITPMQALHLPDTKKHVAVKISYGDQTQSTFSIPPAADLSWYQETKSEIFYHDNANENAFAQSEVDPSNSDSIPTSHARRDFQHQLNESLKKSFQVDTLNIRGSIRIRIVAEGFPKSSTVAQLEIPVLSLLDCLCLQDDDDSEDVYDRWFPMLLSEECIPGEGELGNINRKLTSEKLKYDNFGHGRPCIRLKMNWESDSNNAEAQEVAFRKVIYSRPQTASNSGAHTDYPSSTETPDTTEPSWKLYSRLQLPLISLSLIDTTRSKEVIHVSVIEVDVRHFEADKNTDTMGNVTWVQVDNQLTDALVPVILAPIQVKVHQPIFRIRIRRNNELSKPDITSFDNIELIIQEIDLRLEQSTVLACWDLYQSLQSELRSIIISADGTIVNLNNSEDIKTSIDALGFDTFFTVKDSNSYDLLASLNLLLNGKVKIKQENGLSPRSRPTSQSNFVNPSDHPSSQTQNDSVANGNQSLNEAKFDVIGNEANHTVYIENLFIGPIKINMSFLTSHSIISSSLDLRRSSAEASSDSDTAISSSTDGLGLVSTVTFFLRQVGVVALNLTSSISDVPIFFAGYAVPHLLKTETELTQTLLDHYVLSALGQLYKIVGSLDLVGNPLALVQSLGVGVKDFFYEPAHALITNPNDIRSIGRSVVKGAISFASNTTDGFIGTATTITRSVGRNLAKIAMDSTFLRAREDLQKPVQGVRSALYRPLKDVANGIYCGVVGVVKVPWNETKRHGVSGLVTGVPMGVVGFTPKVLVGVLDAVTHTGDAIREVVKETNKDKNKPVHRLRLSNLFGPDGRLLPYNMRNAVGEFILSTLRHREINLAPSIPRSKISNIFKRQDSRLSLESTSVSGSVQKQFLSLFNLKPVDQPDIKSYPIEDESHQSIVNNVSSIENSYEEPSLSSKDKRNNFETTTRVRQNSLNSSGRSDYSYLKDSKLKDDSKMTETSKKNRRSVLEAEEDITDSNTNDVDSGAVIASMSKTTTQIDSTRDTAEHVIYTAIVNEAPGVDLVIIITTLRVVASHYIRKLKKTSIKELWEAPLDSLTTPVFDQRGGKVTLTLVVNVPLVASAIPTEKQKRLSVGSVTRHSLFAGMASMQLNDSNSSAVTAAALQKAAAAAASFTIKADFEYEDILSVLYNCILAVTGNIEEFRQFSASNAYDNDFAEDEYNIIHIGPWQYVNNDTSMSTSPISDGKIKMFRNQSTNNSEKQEIEEMLNELEFFQWVISPDDENSLSRKKEGCVLPQWLLDEHFEVIRAHSLQKSIQARIKEIRKSGSKLDNIVVTQLTRGTISLEDFETNIRQNSLLKAALDPNASFFQENLSQASSKASDHQDGWFGRNLLNDTSNGPQPIVLPQRPKYDSTTPVRTNRSLLTDRSRGSSILRRASSEEITSSSFKDHHQADISVDTVVSSLTRPSVSPDIRSPAEIPAMSPYLPDESVVSLSSPDTRTDSGPTPTRESTPIPMPTKSALKVRHSSPMNEPHPVEPKSQFLSPVKESAHKVATVKFKSSDGISPMALRQWSNRKSFPPTSLNQQPNNHVKYEPVDQAHNTSESPLPPDFVNNSIASVFPSSPYPQRSENLMNNTRLKAHAFDLARSSEDSGVQNNATAFASPETLPKAFSLKRGEDKNDADIIFEEMSAKDSSTDTPDSEITLKREKQPVSEVSSEPQNVTTVSQTEESDNDSAKSSDASSDGLRSYVHASSFRNSPRVYSPSSDSYDDSVDGGLDIDDDADEDHDDHGEVTSDEEKGHETEVADKDSASVDRSIKMYEVYRREEDDNFRWEPGKDSEEFQSKSNSDLLA